MMRKLLVIAVVALVVGVSCGGDDEPTADTGGGEDTAATTVTASNFAFDPTELTVTSGDSVEFVNEDDTEHSFTVDGTDVEEELEEPGSVDVAIDLDAGEYDFHCKYHPDTMTGTLTVE